MLGRFGDASDWDQTGMTGLKVKYCSLRDPNITTDWIVVEEGITGSWYYVSPNNAGEFIATVSLKYEDVDAVGDNVGITGIDLDYFNPRTEKFV
jgi:hypothetical protein